VDEIDAIAAQVSACQRCDLRLDCTQPVPGSGSQHAKYVIIGDAPGNEEDRAGIPYVGMAGKRLNRLIELAKIDINDVYLTEVVKCRPPKGRHPAKREVKACLPFLLAELEAIKPQYVITLGAGALSLFSSEGVKQIHGTMFQADIQGEWLR
jgi:DNA polymerase